MAPVNKKLTKHKLRSSFGISSEILFENRKARYDFFIDDTLECGICLWGNEVKSILEGRASIKEAWICVQNGELFIKKMQISPWKTSNAFDIEETRDRKLLAHKEEIRKWEQKVKIQGYTLVPLKMYFSNGKVKILVGLCKGKKTYDKRAHEKLTELKLRSFSKRISEEILY